MLRNLPRDWMFKYHLLSQETTIRNPNTKENKLENQEEEPKAKQKLKQWKQSLSKPKVVDSDPRKKDMKKLVMIEILICTKVEFLVIKYLKITDKC